jgi:Helix-turn-helix family
VTRPGRPGRICGVTPEQTAASAKRAVLELGGAFAECPKSLRRARQLGLTGWAFYVAGRGGVLGEVRPDTVAAALGFIAADAVRDGWEAARKVGSPYQVAEHHRQECCRWGREHLDAFPRVSRLVALAEEVVLAADPAGMPLFAAWRAMPMAEDGPGARAAVLGHLLREHRAAATLIAIRAGGLTPLEAILAGPDGEAGAVAFGWQPPFPPHQPLLRRYIRAEAVADRITGEAYAVLGAGQRVELVNLLDAVAAGLRTPAGRHSLI